MAYPNKLLLFDIDWTLLKGTGPIFIEGHRRALKEVLGVDLEESFDITPHEGKTGSKFFIDIAEERGVDPKIVRRKLTKLAKYLSDYCERHREALDIKILPSVEDALQGLQEYGFGLGIVTGNFRNVARLKLEIARIAEYFAFGAYGEESETRADLVINALKNAGTVYNKMFQLTDVLLIGDNTRDIACGLEAGVYTIGVATGSVSEKELRESGAHVVLPSLAEWRNIISFSEDPKGMYESEFSRLKS